ncbi:MAG: VWA domain-containing protein [Cucumibacter sp.]
MTTDKELQSLKNIAISQASRELRELALGMAMEAYDREQARARRGVQGMSAGERLRSISNALRRTFTMDIRIPIGAAAAGLLLLPLALQLNSTTSLTQLPPISQPLPEPKVGVSVTGDESAGQVLTTVDSLPRNVRQENDAADAVGNEQSPSEIAPAPPRGDFRDRAAGGQAPMVLAEPSESGAVTAMRTLEHEQAMPAPYDRAGDRFEEFEDSGVISVADQPVSTFSIDVDTASYSYVRRALTDGFLPAADAVRVEEMINYFPYDYPEPESATVPFQPTVAVYPTPWNPDTQLLHVGIKGYTPPAGADRPANLVFLIDTSGSMDEPDKLPLLKRSFAMLVEGLDAHDTVSIVTYAGSAGTVLMPTPASDKARILDALDNLMPGGSTAGAAGIEEAYRLAERAQIEDGVNRVILATDGDFNVGISSPEELERFIAKKRDEGIFLSVLGFGTGNYNDALMQALAQNGNGNAAYIDRFAEARKVLVEDAGSTLVTIASDVKIQVEFNPALVAEYRLVGYETRVLNNEDFNNDRVDAGDVGAGHTVTAIYEITPVGSPSQGSDPLRYGGEQPAVSEGEPSDEIAFVKLRYKLPGEEASRLIDLPVTQANVVDGTAGLSDDMQFAAAVAGFGQNLRDGQYAGAMSYEEIAELAREGRGADPEGYRSQFVTLVELADSLSASSAR